MVFKLTIALVALASLVSAANYKRVVCSDGNITTNEAVRSNLSIMTVILTTRWISAARSFLCGTISRRTSLMENVVKMVSRSLSVQSKGASLIYFPVHESLRLTFHDAIGFSQSGEFTYVSAPRLVSDHTHNSAEDMEPTVP